MDKPQQLMPTTTGLATLQRPRFIAGMLLEDDDMNAGVNYTLNLTRLLFRSLFGCGVICGLQVTATLICNASKLQITIARGLALDCSGNPIEISEPPPLEFNPDCKAFPPAIWVALCYLEKPCRPKDVSCADGDDGQSQPTRIRAAYEIKLYDRAPACACRCGKDTLGAAPVDEGCGCNNGGQTPAAAPAGGLAATDQANDAPGTTQQVDPCPCYSAHYHGECECSCGCTCVIIGKILPLQLLDRGFNVKVDTDMVRRIRPVLNGYAQCRWPEQKPSSNPPATGTGGPTAAPPVTPPQ